MDNAVSDHVTHITVPNSSYQLLHGTVEPIGTRSVSFDVVIGNTEDKMIADCNGGILNNRNPSSIAEAELLNAACQLAYGSV